MNLIRMTRWFLSSLGVMTLFYCLFVFGYVATNPDIGLRFLLVDDELGEGPKIQRVSSDLVKKERVRRGPVPIAGDELLEMGVIEADGTTRLQKIPTFLHFSRALWKLRSRVPGGGLFKNADPSEEYNANKIGPVAEEASTDQAFFNAKKWVLVKFKRTIAGEGGKPPTEKVFESWIEVKPPTFGSLALSLIWFVLQLGIFGVGALACWTRPYDRSARLFFAMCIVTSAAFVAGYHWWVIVSSIWLLIPFVISVVLVPVVTLHFFLVYPHPKEPIARHPKTILSLLYAPAIVAAALIGTLGTYAVWLSGRPEIASSAITHVLGQERMAINYYLLLACGYFVCTLIALAASFSSTRSETEMNQVKSILWAGVLALVPLGFTMYLVLFDRQSFAMGDGSLPMFIASLLFMAAYAQGMVRHKLMLVDQLFGRETLYLLRGAGIKVVFGVTIAIGSLIASWRNNGAQNGIIIAITLVLAVLVVDWFRDLIQKINDRWFFREKYQLDKSLHRMNRTLGEIMEPALVAERLLATCRDVLMVDEASLYLREPETNTFRLIQSIGSGEFPTTVSIDEGLSEMMLRRKYVQRSIAGTRGSSPKEQRFLQDLRGELLQVLEIDGIAGAFVVLREKRDSAEFTAEDLTFLTAMSQVAGASLHSAKIHRAVDRLNEELQLKVDKIEEQQRIILQLQTEITSRGTPAGGVDASDPNKETEGHESFQSGSIRGKGKAIQRVLDTVRKVAASQSSVLIRGESGTGKELLAQAIHENSPRKGGPLVRVHCGALAAGLLESELFGHVKGAFTGAHRDKVGRFETANGGTLFLDEIGDISLETQIKLLRVLQERTFEPVGSSRSVQVDVRLIAATHQNLERLISEGKFREDLFYRLNVISITSPPLRERAEDILELSLHFLREGGERLGKRLTHIEDQALEAMMRYAWPGNVRQLENAIERACVLAEGDSITLADLPREVAMVQAAMLIDTKPRAGQTLSVESFIAPREPGDGRPGDGRSGEGRIVTGYAGSGSDSEPDRIRNALRTANGNKAEAARMLGMPRSTFFSKLKKYQLG